MKPKAVKAPRQFDIRKGVEVVLLKLFLPCECEVDSRPADEAPVRGLKRIERGSPTEDDFRRRMAAATMGNPHDRRSEVGRVREGRVDDGFPFLGKHGQEGVGGEFLLPALCQGGFVPCADAAHWYVHEFSGRKQQVVVIPLIRQGKGKEVTRPLAGSVIAELSQLLKSFRFTCHGWLNPAGRPSTLNLTYPQVGNAEFAVQIKDGRIGLVRNEDL